MEIIIDDDGIMHRVYTKADMEAMLEEIKQEIKKLDTYDIERTHGLIEDAYVIEDVNNAIQQKINSLKGVEDGTED